MPNWCELATADPPSSELTLALPSDGRYDSDDAICCLTRWDLAKKSANKWAARGRRILCASFRRSTTICAVSASRCPNLMSDTFESLLVDLSRAGVDYLVAGGVAICLNGFVRATQDLDLLVEASPANLQRLLGCLATFGEGFARELSPEDFPMEEGAVRVNEDFTLDLFTLMRNRTFADFVATARRLEIGGVVVRYLAPESLIELKSASPREKDRLDVAALREIIAGAASPSAANLEKLTPPASSRPDESR